MKKVKENWMVIILFFLSFYIMYISDKRVVVLEKQLKSIKDSLDFPQNNIDTSET